LHYGGSIEFFFFTYVLTVNLTTCIIKHVFKGFGRLEV